LIRVQTHAWVNRPSAFPKQRLCSKEKHGHHNNSQGKKACKPVYSFLKASGF
jgi:hypothetical protein